MNELFLLILNMSMSASILVIVVLFLRLILRKAPKWFNVLLWALVGIRLILPFTIESYFSLMPKSDWLRAENDIVNDTGVGINIDEIPIYVIGGDTTNVETNGTVINDTLKNNENSFFNNSILSYIWLFGLSEMLIYMAISYIYICRRIKTAKHFEENIYISSEISSPFLFGIIKPKIFLPTNLDAVNMTYVIAHEKTHLNRLDNLWKPIGFVILSIHWFNPFIWLGFILLCRDIEMACDERVVKNMNASERADYSEALLDCSVSRRMITVSPLAFGEINVKERIKTVLNYKKPALLLIIIAVSAAIVAAICFLTNPPSEIVDENLDDLQDETEITTNINDHVSEPKPVNINDHVSVPKPVLDYALSVVGQHIEEYNGLGISQEEITGASYTIIDARIEQIAQMEDKPEWLGENEHIFKLEFWLMPSITDETRILLSGEMLLENGWFKITNKYIVMHYEIVNGVELWTPRGIIDAQRLSEISNINDNENNNDNQTVILKDGFQSIGINIKHTNSKGKTFDVVLGLALPTGWSVSYNYSTYQVIPFAEYADIKNGEDYVAGIGFLPYEIDEEYVDISGAIFNQIAMGSMTMWNIHQHFDVVSAEDSAFKTALSTVLYSNKIFEDNKERNNSAIVTYHPEYKMYFALEIKDGIKDRIVLSQEDIEYIAKSIQWLSVEVKVD